MPVAVIYIAAALLLAGAMPLPEDYYTLLRVVATAVFAWAAVVSHERRLRLRSLAFILFCLIYNPGIEVELPGAWYGLLHVAAAVLLLACGRQLATRAQPA